MDRTNRKLLPASVSTGRCGAAADGESEEEGEEDDVEE
jgi:hypothetical protein